MSEVVRPSTKGKSPEDLFKIYKQNFLYFVKWYNINLPSLSDDESVHFKELHSKWKSLNKKSLKDIDKSIFTLMKDNHLHLNRKFLLKENNKDDTWRNYIFSGQEFRLTLMSRGEL